MSQTVTSKLVSPIFAMSARYGMHVAAMTGVLVAAVLCSYGSYTRAAAIALASVGAGVLMTARVSLDQMMLFWFAATPVASFYLRFPAERSILTFDRAALALALVFIIAGWRSRGVRATRFEIAWALLSVLALSSALASSNNFGYAVRIAVDSFWLPLLVFHIACHYLDMRNKGTVLVLATMALSLLLLSVGAYEIRTGNDLFQYPGSQIVREGELRVNGPFISDSSYAIICLLLGLFLWSAPSIYRVRSDASGRLAHLLAVAACMVAALLPLFRSVALAMGICVALALYYTGRESKSAVVSTFFDFASRIRARTILPVFVLMIIAGLALMTTTSRGQRLFDPYNVYGRLATWESAASIAIENPIFGVGLDNYPAYFVSKYLSGPGDRDAFMEVRAARSPHSNPLWIAAELGLIAFVLYVTANVYIFRMGYRALGRAETPDMRAAASCYLSLVVAYWIPGLTLSSGVYSDLNLYFFFLLGLVSKKISPGGDASEIEQA